MSLAQALAADPSEWPLRLSIAATVISVATFLYTVFVKPRFDLRQGSLARQIARHDDAISEMRRLLAVDADGIEWTVRQVAMEGGTDPQGLTLDARIEAINELVRRINGLKVDVMGLRFSRSFENFAAQLSAMSNALTQVRAGEFNQQWARDLLAGVLNQEFPEARIKLEQALESPRPERKPPLVSLSVETRRQARRRAAEEDGPAMGC